MYREEKRQRKIFCPMIHSPSERNGRCYADRKPGSCVGDLEELLAPGYGLAQLRPLRQLRVNHHLGLAWWHKWLRSSPCTPRIPYCRRFYPGSPTSLPAPCLWPSWATVEDGPGLWDPAPTWETRKRLLASDRHSIGHCAHLGSESSD